MVFVMQSLSARACNRTSIRPDYGEAVGCYEFQSILLKIVLSCTLFYLFIAIYSNKFTYCPREYGHPSK